MLYGPVQLLRTPLRSLQADSSWLLSRLSPTTGLARHAAETETDSGLDSLEETDKVLAQ